MIHMMHSTSWEINLQHMKTGNIKPFLHGATGPSLAWSSHGDFTIM